MKTNTDTALFYQAETNYGGGDNGGAEYAETHPNADDFVRVNFLAGPIKIKAKSFKRSRLKAPGDGLGKGRVVTVGADFPDIEFSYYLQTAADPFKATTVAGTEGTAGTSYIFQAIIPDPDESGATLVYNIFGAQLTSYSITGKIDEDKPPRVTVKFSCYSMVINTGTAQTATLPAGIINEWDDIVVTLDTDVIAELDEFTLTITTTFTKTKSGRNGSFDKFKPLLLDRLFEYKVSMYKDTAALMLDTITEAINSFTIIWTEGTNTITVTNCYSDGDNLGDITGDDIDEMLYEITIKNGASAFS